MWRTARTLAQVILSAAKDPSSIGTVPLEQ